VPVCEIRSEPLVVSRLEKPMHCQVYFPDTAAMEPDTLVYRVPPVLRVRMPGGRCRERMFKPANTQILIRSAMGEVVGYADPIGDLSGFKVHRSRLRYWDETRLSHSPFRPHRPLFSRTWEFPLGYIARSKCLQSTTVLMLEPGQYTVTFQCRERFEDAPIIMGSAQLVVSETE
jgi:hypothetical protein